MVSIENYVEHFPSKIYGRLKPKGTDYRKGLLEVKDVPTLEIERVSDKKFHSGKEVGQYIKYWGLILRFGSYDDKNHVWVVVESPEGDRIDRNKLGNLLQHPESFSESSKEKKEKYLSIFSRGEINESQESSDTITVKYKIKRSTALAEEEIFEAFWYVFKPILNAIP